MSGEPEVPKGSYAAGRRVRLPRGAGEPIRVHINGVEQKRGVDYEIRGGEIAFPRPIIKETVTPGRWMAMYLGLFGTYRKHETVDVEYTARRRDEAGGRRRDLAGLEAKRSGRSSRQRDLRSAAPRGRRPPRATWSSSPLTRRIVVPVRSRSRISSRRERRESAKLTMTKRRPTTR